MHIINLKSVASFGNVGDAFLDSINAQGYGQWEVHKFYCYRYGEFCVGETWTRKKKDMEDEM